MEFIEEIIEKALNNNDINSVLDLLLSTVERLIKEDVYSKNKQELKEHKETQRDQNVSSSRTPVSLIKD